jgi:hypothetical protein
VWTHETKLTQISLAVRKEVPLTSFEGKPIGTGKPGQLIRELIAAYRKLVDEEVQYKKKP